MANRCYSLAVQGTVNGEFRENVLHFQSTGTADGDTIAAGESLIAAWDASVKAQWLATLPGSYCVNMLSARRVDLKPSATSVKSYGYFAAPGTRGSNTNGQQTCPSIFLVPTMGTKSGGRIFWPGIPNGDLVTSPYSAGWQTVVNTVLATMIGGITSGGITWTLCVYSRKNNTMSSIANHLFSPLVGFQSRRRKPVGAN